MKEHDINRRIKQKIEKSDLEQPLKDFITEIIEFEIDRENDPFYTKKYKDDIEKANILLGRRR